MTLPAGETHRSVATAGPERWRAVADVLAAAFQDDPVLSWLIPSPARRPPALRRFFAIEARAIALPHGHSVAAGDEAAALVLPPGHWRAPLKVQLRHGTGFTRAFGPRLPLAFAVLTALERRHARNAPAPHVYLPYIGVVPAAQGQGVGTALLEPVLERCDRVRLPAYLEASSPGSARLYRRLGFKTLETVRPLGAPPIELMLRP